MLLDVNTGAARSLAAPRAPSGWLRRSSPRLCRLLGESNAFIRTLPGGWAYAAIYANSTERTAPLNGWIDL